jgi:hypothetical protein
VAIASASQLLMRPSMRIVLLISALLASTASAEPARRIEIAIDPLALMRDTYTVDAAYAINDHVAITGGGMYVHPADNSPDWGMNRLQAGVQLFLDRAFQGPFVEAGLRRTVTHGVGYTLDENGVGTPWNADYTTFGPQVSVGWQWTFHDTWTASYALGASKAWSQSGNVLGVVGGTEQDLRLGFVF